MTTQIIAAFDFDGTITTRDTFVPFLYYAFGYPRVLKTFLRLAPRAFLVSVGLSSRDEFKEHLVHSLFFGESVEKLRIVGAKYAKTLKPLYRLEALKRIKWHQSNGHRCIMVSASLDLYLKEVALSLGFDDLLCTVPSHNDLVFDGFLRDGNCRCMEKVNRLRSLVGDLHTFEIFAYGDSIGDRDMIDHAKHGYYRPFLTNKALDIFKMKSDF
ncbi:MAG: HAD family hydrolase [Pseudomonadota bacterium]